jgi:hypothetical protein
VPRGELDRYEQVAGQIVAQQLGGQERGRDVAGAPPGTHDFDITLADGRLIALEVTSAADGAQEALRSLALGRDWKAPSLRHHWWLGVPKDGSIKVKALMTKVVPHLEVLERHNVEQVGGGNRADRRNPPVGVHEEVADAAHGVFDLGADRATRLGAPKRGETALVMASLRGGAGSNFDLLNDLVARCAKAKAEKLVAAAGDERHLFVWMRPSASDAELAMATLPPPVSTPAIPDGINVTWVATEPTAFDAKFGLLWRLEPPGRWEEIGR